MKVLFVLKNRQGYSSTYSYPYEFPSGLFNSAKFVSDMLNDSGIESKVVSVIDNNSIDKEVHDFNPDVVVVEALWVVPEKFLVLKRLYPRIRWIVRIHSDAPFLALEGIAVEWLRAYVKMSHVFVSTNSFKGVHDLKLITGHHHKVILLPNFYPAICALGIEDSDEVVNVGCFGAIRPFKNQFVQALAAIRYGNEEKKRVRFHINATRSEDGDNILRNIRALFSQGKHELIEHPWMERPNFLALLSMMDVSMSVSFSETFCVVAADAASLGVPIVVSDQIPWSLKLSQANPTDTFDIVNKIKSALGWRSFFLVLGNKIKLDNYSKHSKDIWLDELAKF